MASAAYAASNQPIGRSVSTWSATDLTTASIGTASRENGQPSGMPSELLTGFVLENGEARGRPVGVAVDTRGGVLVADDVGNVV